MQGVGTDGPPDERVPTTIDPVRSEVIFTDGTRCDLNAYLDNMPDTPDLGSK